MALPARHLLAQGRVLAALGGTVAEAIGQRLGLSQARSVSTLTLPGPEIIEEVPAPSPALVRDFLRHVGGDPGAWRGRIPPHLFPQWVVPVAARTLRGLPYPMLKVVNGGCRLQVNAPLAMPGNGRLQVRAQLMAIDDDGRRAVLRQRVVTGPTSAKDAGLAGLDALVIDLYVIVPSRPPAATGGGDLGDGTAAAGARTTTRKVAARVPDDAREIAALRLPADAGLAFGLLTGDVNPLHWVGPYARAAGFRRPILHGFSTMARAIEAIDRGLHARGLWVSEASNPSTGSAPFIFDVRFSRPLPLPARVGVFVHGHELWVGDAPGGPAYLVGSFGRGNARKEGSA